ncbi:methyltransferase domain-containing protein [Candidatus Omnitrophota bacterium]
MMFIKILLIIMYREEASAQIRLINPLNELCKRQYLSYELFTIQELNLKKINLDDFDIILMQRVKELKGLYVTLQALKKKIPIGFDIDDNLIDPLPLSHPYRAWYSSFIRLTCINQIIKNVDFITVATKALSERISSLGLTKIVPNTINCQNKRSYGKSNNSKVRIGYAGSLTHENDFSLILPAIKKILNEYKDKVEFYFLGYLPAGSGMYPQIKYQPHTVDYRAYLDNLTKIGLDIGLAPLEESLFNSYKSNIKFLEYSLAGAAGIYSNVRIYQETISHNETGSIVSNKENEWYCSIKHLIDHPEARKEMAEKARLVVHENYKVKNASDLLMNIFLEQVDAAQRRKWPHFIRITSLGIILFLLKVLERIQACKNRLYRIKASLKLPAKIMLARMSKFNLFSKNIDSLCGVVCGFERGGTTITSQLAAQHAEVFSGFEVGALFCKTPKEWLNSKNPWMNGMFWDYWPMRSETAIKLKSAKTWSDFYRLLKDDAGTAYILDKTPRYQEKLVEILTRYNRLKAIVVIKKPILLYHSWLKYKKGPLDCFIEDYRNRMRETELALELFPHRVLLINFEDVIVNTASTKNKMLDFLGLKREPVLPFNTTLKFIRSAHIQKDDLKREKLVPEKDRLRIKRELPEYCYRVNRPKRTWIEQGKSRIHSEMKLAHKHCKGIGVELGAASQNPFGLPGAKNCAPYSKNRSAADYREYEFYRKAQLKACGMYADIDLAGTAESIPVEDNSQDYIISSHVIEHVPSPIGAFLEWNRSLKTGGIVFMIFPKRDALIADRSRPVSKIREFIDVYEGKGSKCTQKGHLWIFTLRSMLSLIDWCNKNVNLRWQILETEETDSKVGNGHTVVARYNPNV